MEALKKQDEAYAKQALELARTARRAIEEGLKYIEDIRNEDLREKIELEFDAIVDGVNGV